MGKVMFIFWCLIALFILIPITNVVTQTFVADNGTLSQTFNASDPSSWNTTGQIVTSEQVDRLGLTDFERAALAFYVPAMVIFFIVIIFWVLSNRSGTKGVGGE